MTGNWETKSAITFMRHPFPAGPLLFLSGLGVECFSLLESSLSEYRTFKLGSDTTSEYVLSPQSMMHHTEDHIEGVNAILEKRAAKFEGK